MKQYRSTLFVPGNRADWIDKAPKYGPDALIIDLEDAVPIAEKESTRPIVRDGIGRSHQRGMPIVVRVNGSRPRTVTRPARRARSLSTWTESTSPRAPETENPRGRWARRDRR